MDRIGALKELYNIALKNKELHRFIIGELSRLNIVLFNLKIEGAKISEANGVGVIADELQKINKSIEKGLKDAQVEESHIVDLLNYLK